MGAATSTTHEAKAKGRSDQEIIDLVLPLYYTKDRLTAAEREAAVSAWKMIMNDHSEHFNFMKENKAPDFVEHANPMELFYYTFYTRLFDVHPIAKTLFHRALNKQGTFFVRFISMAITQLDDAEKWAKSFNNLTDIHNKMGVKAIEYGIVGDVLIYSIQKCVGPVVYNEVVHNGWAKIYSRMLDIIVPNAVMFELNHKHRAEEAATKRFKDVSKAEAVVATQARSDGSTIFNNRSANAAGHSTSATPPHSIGMNSGGPAVKTSAPSAAAEKARVGVKAPPKEDGLRTPTMDHEEDDKKPEADDATHNSSSRGSAKALQDNSRKARENVEILGAASRR